MGHSALTIKLCFVFSPQNIVSNAFAGTGLEAKINSEVSKVFHVKDQNR